ncbi:MAG: hypothetical protein ACLGI2_06295 [Acidimicrobiia bacterium]
MNRSHAAVERAILASLVVNVALQLSVFLPGLSDDVPSDAKVVGVVVGAIAALGAWGLWNRRRWGWRTTLVITVLNVLSAMPYFLDPTSGAVTAAAVATVLLGIAAVALLLSRPVKAELGRQPVAA